MLDYNLIRMKPDITIVKDNEYVQCKDLTTQVYKGIEYNKGSFVITEEYYIARPDLISLAVYGDDKYGDVICKANGISNPFELNKGMILYIPDIDYISRVYQESINVDDVLDEFKTLDNQTKEFKGSNYKVSKSNSKETIDKKKKKLQKYKNERRSPGEQTVSDKNYTIDRTLGIVIY